MQLRHVMLRPAAPPPPSVAVVITLSHNTRYTPDEETSFRHVRHYLGRHDKYVVMPESHAAIYPGLLPMRFANRFFGATRPHASLLRSEAFYRAFREYEFLLVCHLDARVCSDRLFEWCRAGYDYIPGSGFSVRRVASFLRVLECRRGAVRGCIERLLPFMAAQWLGDRGAGGGLPEERFWSEYAAQRDPTFRIAPVDVAARLTSEPEGRVLRHGLGSDVRVRTAREARAWGDVEIRFARLSHRAMVR